MVSPSRTPNTRARQRLRSGALEERPPSDRRNARTRRRSPRRGAGRVTVAGASGTVAIAIPNSAPLRARAGVIRRRPTRDDRCQRPKDAAEPEGREEEASPLLPGAEQVDCRRDVQDVQPAHDDHGHRQNEDDEQDLARRRHRAESAERAREGLAKAARPAWKRRLESRQAGSQDRGQERDRGKTRRRRPQAPTAPRAAPRRRTGHRTSRRSRRGPTRCWRPSGRPGCG